MHALIQWVDSVLNVNKQFRQKEGKQYVAPRIHLVILKSTLHGNGSGNAEAESYGSVETIFFKKLGSGSVLEAYIYIYIYTYHINPHIK